MTAFTQKPGSKVAFTITLNALANVTYVGGTAVDLLGITGVTANCLPLDVLLELQITPGVVANNKQALLFVQASLDNSVFTSGPTSGTTVTDQPDLYLVGALPLNTASTQQTKSFSLLAALGFIPRAIKPIVFNDSGVAFGGAGNACSYQVYVGDGT